MPKNLDVLMRELGITESDVRLIRCRPGLRRSIGMHIKSQCRTARKLPRLSEKEITTAVARINARGEKVTHLRMSLEVGFGLFGRHLFRQVLRDFPKLEAAYERTKRA